MIKSMTAYSRAEKHEKSFRVVTEIRSYNSRYLDIVLRVPHMYQLFEERIKGLISENIVRGRIEVKIDIIDDSEEAYAFEVNNAKAMAYHAALTQLRDSFRLDTDISLDLVANVNGIIRPIEMEVNEEFCWPIIRDCIISALDALNEMRRREGEYIYQDFIERLKYIERCINQIDKESQELLPLYQERLKERITALTKDIIDIDPARIAQEAAFLADRSDITEEIVRAKSHINQFRTFMDSQEPAGRNLNFILQEFNREFNTMGAKTLNIDASHMIVTVKSELEKIREQVQNVE